MRAPQATQRLEPGEDVVGLWRAPSIVSWRPAHMHAACPRRRQPYIVRQDEAARMDREQLMKAKEIVPDLNDRWQQRRSQMQDRLENAWEKLGEENGGSPGAPRRLAPTLYKEIVRTDRVISFLDRALVHLDDIEHGTDLVEGMEIRPAASHTEAQRMRDQGVRDTGKPREPGASRIEMSESD
jgi:hypothetical protein